MQFSASFRRLHALVGKSVSIEQLARIANPAALGLNDKRDFYDPVRFCIALGPECGALRIGVPVALNDEWHTELKRRVAATLALSAAEDIELRTINEVPLHEVPIRQLAGVGHLNVYNRGKLVRLAALPTVPIEFSATKLNALAVWVKETVGRELVEKITKELQHKDVHEIDEAISSDGAIALCIREHLDQSGPRAQDWSSFARKYHVDSPQQLSAAAAESVLETATKHVLRAVRSYIKAGRPQIQQQIAVRKAQQSMVRVKGKGEEELYAPIMSAVDAKPSSSAAAAAGDGGAKLFRKLMADALATPRLRQALVNCVFRAPISAPRAVIATGQAQKPSPIGDGFTSHPWHLHTHKTLLPLRGSYPSDYMARHTKQDLSSNAPYAGNTLQTYERYHLYSGRMPAPPGLLVRGGVPQPIECHHWRGKNKKQKKKCLEEMKSEYPPLVPIGGQAAAAAGRRLIPISEILASVSGNMPQLIPLSKPLSRGLDIENEMRSRLIEDEGGDDQELMHMEPELPPLEDLFK